MKDGESFLLSTLEIRNHLTTNVSVSISSFYRKKPTLTLDEVPRPFVRERKYLRLLYVISVPSRHLVLLIIRKLLFKPSRRNKK